MLIYLLDITPANLLFIMNVGWHRLFFRITNKLDPTSSPYLSGDGFRSLAQHIFDERATFSPESVKEKDIIFVGFTRLQEYFATIHPQIKHRYILITHNGDLTIDASWAKLIDHKIIHWFSQNVSVKHPKLTPIPIGLENLDYYNHGIPSMFDQQRQRQVSKVPRILCGFSLSTNPKVRTNALHKLQQIGTADQILGRLNAESYLKILNRYMFVASPPGNGTDCHRTWEAMYLDVIPIVLRSEMTEYFYSLGLPLMIVDDWLDLEEINEKELYKIYTSLSQRFFSKCLWITYWDNKIKLLKKI